MSITKNETKKIRSCNPSVEFSSFSFITYKAIIPSLHKLSVLIIVKPERRLTIRCSVFVLQDLLFHIEYQP